jgi:hypothetical protein
VAVEVDWRRDLGALDRRANGLNDMSGKIGTALLQNKDDGHNPMVRVPLRPTPTLRDSSAALPEPLGDDLQD